MEVTVSLSMGIQNSAAANLMIRIVDELETCHRTRREIDVENENDQFD